jgi:hypothetical protein
LILILKTVDIKVVNKKNGGRVDLVKAVVA